MAAWSILWEVLWFVLASLFGWAVTNFLARQRGPFKLGTALRSAFGVMHDEQGFPQVDPVDGSLLVFAVTRSAKLDNFLWEIAHMLVCFECCSFWVALLVCAPLLAHGVPTLFMDWQSAALVVGALSTVMIWIDSKIGAE